MSLLRSDKMAYYNIVIPRESAWEVLNQLGQVQVVQFEDQNAHESHMSRVFTPQIKRAEDILNQIHIIHNLMVAKQKEVTKCDNIQAYLDVLEVYLRGREKAYHTFIDDVESQVKDAFAKLNEQTFTLESLTSKYYSLIEYSNVLRKFKEKVVDQRIMSYDFQFQIFYLFYHKIISISQNLILPSMPFHRNIKFINQLTNYLRFKFKEPKLSNRFLYKACKLISISSQKMKGLIQCKLTYNPSNTVKNDIKNQYFSRKAVCFLNNFKQELARFYSFFDQINLKKIQIKQNNFKKNNFLEKD